MCAGFICTVKGVNYIGGFSATKAVEEQGKSVFDRVTYVLTVGKRYGCAIESTFHVTFGSKCCHALEIYIVVVYTHKDFLIGDGSRGGLAFLGIQCSI